jgi:hypothetical protein
MTFWMRKTAYMVIVHSSSSFPKPKENLSICQCLASNPEQCTVRLVHHHLFLKFCPSSLHTWEKLAFRHTDFSDGVILGLGIR